MTVLFDGIPVDWRIRNVVTLFKIKGDLRLCEKYRAQYIAYRKRSKYGKSINNRLQQLTAVSENQCDLYEVDQHLPRYTVCQFCLEKIKEIKKD